jgi:hypothetical protein
MRKNDNNLLNFGQFFQITLFSASLAHDAMVFSKLNLRMRLHKYLSIRKTNLWWSESLFLGVTAVPFQSESTRICCLPPLVDWEWFALPAGIPSDTAFDSNQ